MQVLLGGQFTENTETPNRIGASREDIHESGMRVPQPDEMGDDFLKASAKIRLDGVNLCSRHRGAEKDDRHAGEKIVQACSVLHWITEHADDPIGMLLQNILQNT